MHSWMGQHVPDKDLIYPLQHLSLAGLTLSDLLFQLLDLCRRRLLLLIGRQLTVCDIQLILNL